LAVVNRARRAAF
jgi:hypothetical protein